MRIKLGDCAGVVLTDKDYERVDEEVKEWLKEYPWLQKPAMKEILKEALILKKRIDRLQRWMEKPANAEYRESAVFLYDKLVQRWRMLLSSMGVTHTAQQYIKSAEKRGKTPEEILAKKQETFEQMAEKE